MKKIYILITVAILFSLPANAAKTKSSVVNTTAIEGQGFLKTKGGDVKTCAGEIVSVYTKNDYQNLVQYKNYEKMILKIAIYRKEAESFGRYRARKANLPEYKNLSEYIKILNEQYPELDLKRTYQLDFFIADLQKVIDFESKKLDELGGKPKVSYESQCDAYGNFGLKNIPFGNYGIVTRVSWTNGESIQGGEVGKEIIVDEKLQKIFITNLLLE